MNKNYLFILGAQNPEMDKIEQLLVAAGMSFIYATANGQRVDDYSAYSADIINAFELNLPSKSKAILVECCTSFLFGSYDIHELETIFLGHHRIIDPSYALGPEDFFLASSIGRVLYMLAASMSPDDFIETLDRYTGKDNVKQFKPMSQCKCKECKEPMMIQLDRDFAVEIPVDIVYTAAADHCLTEALAGKCPGVDPDKLSEFVTKAGAAGHIMAKVA